MTVTTRPRGAKKPPDPAAKRITFLNCHVEGPYVAITFDDGPNSNTTALINLLKQHNLTPVTFFNQGNIDGKFTVTFDKFFSAIQWVNQPITMPVLAHAPGNISRFF